MRMMPSRYLSPAPLKTKKRTADVKHFQAPLKGLSLTSKLVTGDPLKAPILDNWVVEEDKISCRPGIHLQHALPSITPISAIVPFYGAPQAMLLAQDTSLFSTSDVAVGSGFTSDDWAWTAFSNLGARDYTIMVNGADGVWSWDGGSTADPAQVTVLSLSNTNPAVVTVAPADIGKFSNGQAVRIAGAVGTGMTAANGTHYITLVGEPANKFTLAGVNTSTGTAPQTSGVIADPPGSVAKEVVTAPAGKTYILPGKFNVVLSHMNRLWFADATNLAIYYLPLQQKSGEVAEIPLNALFKRGGHIVAMYSWTLDGGAGMDDQIVIFSSNGEAAIYGGIDPASDFNLTGLFRFDSPMSKHCVANYGGDLYVLTSTGLLPMSTMLRAESEKLGQFDTDVTTAFSKAAQAARNSPGWQIILDYTTGRVICNLPSGARNSYTQMVRFMPDPKWASWSALPSRCWQWIDNRLWMGSDDGKLYEMDAAYLSDNGNPITVDVQFAWSLYNTPSLKHFKMVLVYMLTEGTPRPFVDIKVDYDMTLPFNQPDVTTADASSLWDIATWDEDFWSASVVSRSTWQGVGKIGRVGAPRVRAAIVNCTFAIAGVDVEHEIGGPVG